MATESNDKRAGRRLRPALRPFVLRPIVYAMMVAAFPIAASYFFWTPLRDLIGTWAWALPALGCLLIIGVLLDRVARYRKTQYEVGPERIVVETGSLLRSRRVELDLRNITQVSWVSPWLLRKIYDVGHVTAQEAGNSAEPAKMAYIEDPGALYQTIGEHMRSRGFTMDRARMIQQEEPGHLGAVVDLLVGVFKLFWAVILVGAQFAFEAMPIIIGEGPSLLQLLAGNYEVFADMATQSTLVKARVGVVTLGGAAAVLVTSWFVLTYIDLLRRRYTLYDDVIDYVDGFLTETRQFIPLENLADTEVSKPMYKRFLGLSDVRLSSQGAENAIVFASTPNGTAFAKSVEQLVRRESGVGGRVVAEGERADQAAPDEVVDERGDTGVPVLECGPEPMRAVMRGLGLAGVFVPFVVAWLLGLVSDSFEFGLFETVGVLGAFMTGLLVLVASSVFGAVWWGVRARATQFLVDGDGVRVSYQLLSSRDTRFALERITSMSVIENPVDRLLGTMTIRFRSVGSEQDLDFWGVSDGEAITTEVLSRLGISTTRNSERRASLTPDFQWLDGVRALGPWVALLGLLALAAASVAYFLTGILWSVLVVAGALVMGLGVFVWRRFYLNRINGDVFDSHAEISGGILRLYRHVIPLEYVKSVEAMRYPGTRHGRLTFRTPGYPVSIAHLQDVFTLQDSLDRLLTGSDAAVEGATDMPVYKPRAATELLRYSPLILTVVGGLALPFVFLYYRRVEYAVEQRRLVGRMGIYFDRHITVRFAQIDHIESKRNLAHSITGTQDIEVYTVGSSETDLVLRSIDHDGPGLQVVRERLERG